MPSVRPTFFARETVRELAAVCRQLGLRVIDPQHDPAEAREFDEEALVDSWSRINALEVSALQRSAAEFNHAPEPALHRWWWYQYNLPKIQSSVGVFTPQMFPMTDPETGSFVSVATWTDFIPTVLPPADYIVLMSESDPGDHFATAQRAADSPIVGMQEVIKPIFHLVRRVETPVGWVDVLAEDSAERAAVELAALTVRRREPLRLSHITGWRDWTDEDRAVH